MKVIKEHRCRFILKMLWDQKIQKCSKIILLPKKTLPTIKKAYPILMRIKNTNHISHLSRNPINSSFSALYVLTHPGQSRPNMSTFRTSNRKDICALVAWNRFIWVKKIYSWFPWSQTKCTLLKWQISCTKQR